MTLPDRLGKMKWSLWQIELREMERQNFRQGAISERKQVMKNAFVFILILFFYSFCCCLLMCFVCSTFLGNNTAIMSFVSYLGLQCSKCMTVTLRGKYISFIDI